LMLRNGVKLPRLCAANRDMCPERITIR
jgi:hypothetical protein